VVRKLTLLAAILVMLLVATTAALAQTIPDLGSEDESICLLPEGCDTNGDAIPDFWAGEPTGGVQYVDQLQYR
jgi:hypothetical protein